MTSWWRAQDRRYANFDPFEEFEQTGSHIKIEYREYTVLKETPKGVWLKDKYEFYDDKKFFVLGTARRQTAVPTKELALNDLLARKKKHVYYCELRTKSAEENLAHVERTIEWNTVRGNL